MITIKIELPPEIVMQTEREIHITMDENGVTSNVCKEDKDVSLSAFIRERIDKLYAGGHYRTAETYRSALNSFTRFREGKDIPLQEITQETIKDYECYLKKNGLRMNTVSFYMRILRAVYNKAVADGIIQDCHPFLYVYTGIGKTRKRALPIEVIKKIKNADLKSETTVLARDVFLFSFYTRGMAFVDIAFLRKKDLDKGVLTYKRKKTGQMIKIKWERCMQEIADKHRSDDGNSFMFPIITDEDGTETRQYRSKQSEINRQLKNIGLSLGIDTRLTMYVARHSWASIAKTMNIPLAVISDSMGHHSIKTTQIYLDTIDSDVIDKANNSIINSLE